MKFFQLLLLLVASLVTALPYSRQGDWGWDDEFDYDGFERDSCYAYGIHLSRFANLARKLSRNATIVLPDNPLMRTTHLRWQAYAEPTYSAVVEVTTEEDVVHTVHFPLLPCPMPKATADHANSRSASHEPTPSPSSPSMAPTA